MISKPRRITHIITRSMSNLRINITDLEYFYGYIQIWRTGGSRMLIEVCGGMHIRVGVIDDKTLEVTSVSLSHAISVDMYRFRVVPFLKATHGQLSIGLAFNGDRVPETHIYDNSTLRGYDESRY